MPLCAMDDNCPESLALRYAVTSSEFLKPRRGRPRSNLFTTLANDLKEHNIKLADIDDLCELKVVAYDRAVWRSLFVYRNYYG